MKLTVNGSMPDHVFRDLSRRFWRYSRPDTTFSYRDADDTMLSDLGFPTSEILPVGSRVRSRLSELFEDVSFLEPTYSVEGVEIKPRPLSSMGLFGGPGLDDDAFVFRGDDSSGNWSGRYITPRNGRRFSFVTGEWRIPALESPPAEETETTNAASIWVGLDGQRRYLNSSLPQIGTWHSIWSDSNGQLTSNTYFWWQWYVNGHPFPSVKIALPVAVGDDVAAVLYCSDARSASFIAVNRTKKIANAPCLVMAPTVLDRFENSPVPLQVSGATAQWIFEKPSTYPEEIPHRLPKLSPNEIEFKNCWAVETRIDAAPVERNLDGSRGIRMRELDTSKKPARLRTAAEVGAAKKETAASDAPLTHFKVRVTTSQ